MLEIYVPPSEMWSEENAQFIYTRGQTLKLEHSLISISKWESHYKKPFLDSRLSRDEVIYYTKCMTLNSGIDESTYYALTSENVKKIQDYIADPMTATIINEYSNKRASSHEFITSELIYYWMIANQIPFECQKWHINRLLTLIRICTAKQQTGNKMSEKETLNSYRALNKARRAKMKSSG